MRRECSGSEFESPVKSLDDVNAQEAVERVSGMRSDAATAISSSLRACVVSGRIRNSW